MPVSISTCKCNCGALPALIQYFPIKTCSQSYYAKLTSNICFRVKHTCTHTKKKTVYIAN